MGGLAFIGGILLIIVGLLWCSIQDNGVKETGFVILAIIASAIIVGFLAYLWYLLITYPKELFTVILYIILSIIVLYITVLTIVLILKPSIVSPEIRYIVKKICMQYKKNGYVLSDTSLKKTQMHSNEVNIIQYIDDIIGIDISNYNACKDQASYRAHEVLTEYTAIQNKYIYNIYQSISNGNAESYLEVICDIYDIIDGKMSSDRYICETKYRYAIARIEPIVYQIKCDIEQFVNYADDTKTMYHIDVDDDIYKHGYLFNRLYIKDNDGYFIKC